MKYRKKTGGFSLVEIIVAVAIIAILSGLVVPQVRKQIAKSKDARAMSTLNAFRVAVQMYQIENDDALIDKNNLNSYDAAATKTALEKLLPYLDSKAEEVVKANGEIGIGASQESNTQSANSGKIIYGGKVRMTFVNPDDPTKSDGYYLWLEAGANTGDLDTKGQKWTTY